MSVQNGREPFWRGDGRELYYHGPDRSLMGVAVDLSRPTPVIGPPRPVVPLHFRGWDVRYHVAPMPDGSAFVMNVPVAGSPPPPLSFVMNWCSRSAALSVAAYASGGTRVCHGVACS